uniref:Uncharacterized protein n=1 Tax=Meloidogyne floridensis TaxID=298350 RepID=A0A915NCW1_9BILA
MDAGQKEMLNNGAEAVGTSGQAFRFLNWVTLLVARDDLRYAHLEFFYNENGGQFSGQAISRNQTASTVIITSETDK